MRILILTLLLVVVSGCVSGNAPVTPHKPQNTYRDNTGYKRNVSAGNDLQRLHGRLNNYLQSEEYVSEPNIAQQGRFNVPVESVQEALRNAGYYRGKIDGKIGGQTKSAIGNFQRDNGLKSDGIVGAKTWQVLKKYLKNKR